MWHVVNIRIKRDADNDPLDDKAFATIVGTFANHEAAVECARILNLSDNEAVLIERPA